MQRDIFGIQPPPPKREASNALSTWQTPTWAAEALVEEFYPDLSASDSVLEPTCGEGSFLDAIPRHVHAVGVEMDPKRAAIARARTGREVIVADILTLDAFTPSVIIGNPPFEATFIDTLLDRAHRWLPDEGRCGLILPAFVMSTSSRVSRESERWAISSDMIPRELFPHLRLPVIFCRFEKRAQRTLIGFKLFPDMAVVRSLTKRARQILENGRAPAWRSVVFDALHECGGEATLDMLYRVVEGRRPTNNVHWKQKIRQVVHCYAQRVGPATYRLPTEAAE